MIHICTKSQVNQIFGSREEEFLRFSKIITVQENPSWRTLWVLEAFLFLMKNEACTPSFRRIGAMGWKCHHFENWTFGRGLWRPLWSDVAHIWCGGTHFDVVSMCQIRKFMTRDFLRYWGARRRKIIINIAASSDAGSSAKWQNIINMYTVEDRELDNKRAKLLHVWPTTGWMGIWTHENKVTSQSLYPLCYTPTVEIVWIERAEY